MTKLEQELETLQKAIIALNAIKAGRLVKGELIEFPRQKVSPAEDLGRIAEVEPLYLPKPVKQDTDDQGYTTTYFDRTDLSPDGRKKIHVYHIQGVPGSWSANAAYNGETMAQLSSDLDKPELIGHGGAMHHYIQDALLQALKEHRDLISNPAVLKRLKLFPGA